MSGMPGRCPRTRAAALRGAVDDRRWSHAAAAMLDRVCAPSSLAAVTIFV
jgi:hypothetical protein